MNKLLFDETKKAEMVVGVFREHVERIKGAVATRNLLFFLFFRDDYFFFFLLNSVGFCRYEKLKLECTTFRIDQRHESHVLYS